MDQEIASALNIVRFHQKARAHIRIINAKRPAECAITASTHLNATAVMALQYRDIIIKAARTFNKGVMDVEENESREWWKIHAVPLILYIGKGTEGLPKMRSQCERENEGIVICTQVWWLANPLTIRERMQKEEIAALLVVFIVQGRKVPQSLVKYSIKAAVVWYRVKTYTNEGPDTRCELCCGWGHIENKWGSKPKCGYSSGHHWTSDHKCNEVWCTAMQGSLCGHTLEKCPNCKGNHVTFSSRCAKKREATKVARQSWKKGQQDKRPRVQPGTWQWARTE
jgi:hypothetical protein